MEKTYENSYDPVFGSASFCRLRHAPVQIFVASSFCSCFECYIFPGSRMYSVAFCCCNIVSTCLLLTAIQSQSDHPSHSIPTPTHGCVPFTARSFRLNKLHLRGDKRSPRSSSLWQTGRSPPGGRPTALMTPGWHRRRCGAGEEDPSTSVLAS